MAPKTKGLNIGDTDAILKALGRPKTISEIFKQILVGEPIDFLIFAMFFGNINLA